MRLIAMQCTAKFKQNGGVGVTIHFHSANKESMAVIVVSKEIAESFRVGDYYDVDASPQRSRFTD